MKNYWTNPRIFFSKSHLSFLLFLQTLRLYIRVPTLKSLTLVEVASSITLEDLKKKILEEVKEIPQGSINLLVKDKSMALNQLNGKKVLSSYNLVSSTILYVEFDEKQDSLSNGANVTTHGNGSNTHIGNSTTGNMNVSNVSNGISRTGSNANGNIANTTNSRQNPNGVNNRVESPSPKPVGIYKPLIDRIFVTPPSGPAMCINVCNTDKIKDVKNKIQAKSLMPVPSFDLCKNLLNPAQTLSQCGVTEGSVLRMTLKLRDNGARTVKVTFESRTFPVDIHEADTIEYFKLKLQSITGLASDRQCLTYNGVELFDNDHTVLQYKIENNSDIILSDLLQVFG